MGLKDLDQEQVRQLSSEVVWNSVFYHDFENSFGIDEHEVGDTTDGYLDWLVECFPGEDWQDLLDRYLNDHESGYSFWTFIQYMIVDD